MAQSLQVKRELYGLGNLSWLLRESQLAPYQAIKSKNEREIIACLHRGAGKSFLAALMAVEHALKFPNSTIHYASLSAKFVERIVLPNVRFIISACNPENAPKFVSKDSVMNFPNGSRIFLYGADNTRAADSGRGVNADAVIIDEKGFLSNADYLVRDVLSPRMGLHTWILNISTPATSSAHPFNQEIQASENKPNFFRYTINDNVSITPELRQMFLHSAGGEHTARWRREYMCEVVTDQERALFPSLVDTDIEAFIEPATPNGGDITPKRVDVGLFSAGTSMAAAAVISTPDAHILSETASWHMPPLDKIERFIRDLEAKHGVKANVVTNAPEELRLLLIRNAGIQATPKDARDMLPMFYQSQALIVGNRIYAESHNNELHKLFKGAIWNERHTALDDDGYGGSFESVKAAVLAIDRASKNKPRDPEKAQALNKALFGNANR